MFTLTWETEVKTVSMLEFRRNALPIIKQALRGQRLLLTYRGKPVLRLEPVGAAGSPDEDDPFYSLSDLAEAGGDSLDIDRVVYEG